MFHISEFSIVEPSSCGFSLLTCVRTTSLNMLYILSWTELTRHFVMFPFWFKEHKQHLSYGRTDTLILNLFSEMNTIVFMRWADVQTLRAQILHNLSWMVMRKLNVCVCVQSKYRDKAMYGNQDILYTCQRMAVIPRLHVCPSACCVVCLDWGWGISLGPCCGWTCLSPLCWSETLIISLVWTVITPSLFFEPAPPASQASVVGRRRCGPAWSRTPKSILEMEAEGDVTRRYVPRSMCLDYGPRCHMCPSLTGVTHKANIQSCLFMTQMHAWHCKATERLMVR